MIDLHCHTYYSDGRASPEELIRYAAKIGVQTLAITDHDNTRGSREVAPLARQLGVNLIPAIEMTTTWMACNPPHGATNIDLLGYFLDFNHPQFQEAEKTVYTDFTDTLMPDLCHKLAKAGYPITMQDLYAVNPRYPGPLQLLEALVNKGLVSDRDTAGSMAGQYFDALPFAVMQIEDAIRIFHAAGGVAVLAHPVIIPWRKDTWLDAEGIGLLAEMGLDGIEVYHHRLNAEARAHFSALAKRFGLAVSGGSDEHGLPEGFPWLGCQPVTLEMVQELKSRTNRHS